MGRVVWKVAVLFAMGLVVGGCGGDRDAPRGGVVRFAFDPAGQHGEFMKRILPEFTRATGIAVEIVEGPSNASERLTQYEMYLGVRSERVDLYQIDVIWPGQMADHMIDLGPAFADDLADFFPTIVENNTVRGKLVGMPWFADAGILYYRADLLEKYGVEPPATWGELEAAAALIQEGERADNENFAGFVWHGRAVEGLTCSVLEWISSETGEGLLNAQGRPAMATPGAIAALERARGWIGTISPPETSTMAEVEIVARFRDGDAAFLRSWSVFYSSLETADSPVRGRVGYTMVPGGAAGRASTLGGWQLAVSRYSPNQEAALTLVRWLTGREFMERRALETGILPTRLSVYDSEALHQGAPHLGLMRDVFLNSVARPSTALGARYNEFSALVYSRVGDGLTGRMTMAEALAAIDKTWRPNSTPAPDAGSP